MLAPLLRRVLRPFRAVFPHQQGLPGRNDNDGSRTILARLFGWKTVPAGQVRETDWLDGLRGIAATLVMSYHFHMSWWWPYHEAPFGAAADLTQFWRLPFVRLLICGGHAQVSVFFVLSGFVLSWSPLVYIRRGEHDKLFVSLSSATLRRWMRLYLPCFVVGLIMFLLDWNGWVPSPVDKRSNIISQLSYYFWQCEEWSLPWRIERNEYQQRFAYNWNWWTIPLEFTGSLVVFVILFGIARIENFRKRIATLLALAAYACCRAYWHYWLFVSGMAMADYVQQAGGFMHLSLQLSRGATIAWAAVLALGWYLAGVPEHSQFYGRSGYELFDRLTPATYMQYEGGVRFWWSWAGILILFAGCHLSGIRQLCEHSVVRYLGKVSFMLYLTHRTIHDTAGKPFREWFIALFGLGDSALQQLLLWIVSWSIYAPLAILLAHWLTLLVDQPCLQFSRRVERYLVKGSDEHLEPLYHRLPVHQ